MAARPLFFTFLVGIPVGLLLLFSGSKTAKAAPATPMPGRPLQPPPQPTGGAAPQVVPTGGAPAGGAPAGGGPAPLPEPPAPPEPPPEFVDVGDPLARLIPPQPPSDSRAQLAADVARLLWGLQPGQETAEDRSLIAAYQEQEALNASGNYGPGTGRSFLKYGIVPPHPFYWPSRGRAASKSEYRANMLWQAHLDPERAEEWQQAAAIL